MSEFRFASFLAMALMVSTPALALDDPKTPLKDPMASGMWSYHQVEILGDPVDIRFDDRVVVRAPSEAEDPFSVPVLVDATAVPDVKRIVLLVDYGPIPKILTFWPGMAKAQLSFRFKIDQTTPVRAAVETHSGSWHIGQTVIEAAGGGCTAPAVAYASDDWEEELGKVYGQLWPERGRMRMIVDHPMDTGLADGIPVFVITDLNIDAADGTNLARLELHEPVNEDPAFTLYFPDGGLGDQVRVHGRDNNGNEIDAMVGAGVSQ